MYIYTVRKQNFGLIVKQWGYRTTVIAPTTYANPVCGICGDWNGIFCIFCRFFCLLTIKIFFPQKNVTNEFNRDLSVFQEPESIGAV